MNRQRGQEDGILSTQVLGVRAWSAGAGATAFRGLREYPPLRSTGWPGLLTDGSVETEEGALAGPDSASPTGTSKSWEKGLELGAGEVKVEWLCWGSDSPAWGRQAGLEEHLSKEAGLRLSSHPGAPQAECASSSPGCG